MWHLQHLLGYGQHAKKWFPQYVVKSLEYKLGIHYFFSFGHKMHFPKDCNLKILQVILLIRFYTTFLGRKENKIHKTLKTKSNPTHEHILKFKTC